MCKANVTVPEGVDENVITALEHHQLLNRLNQLKRHLAPGSVLHDGRSVLARDLVGGRL